MSIDGLFVIPTDLTFVPVDTLGEEEARKLDDDGGGILLTRRHGRSGSKVIAKDAAELLQKFNEPKTIVQAIIEYTSGRDLDAEAVLENAYPMIDLLIRSRFLMPADQAEGEQEHVKLEPGSRVDEWIVEGAVSVLEDMEIYRLRSDSGAFAALKIMRGATQTVRELLEREAHVLRHLDGRVGPRLISKGELGDRSYLVMEWVSGASVTRLAARLRKTGDAAGQAQLDRLCAGILQAYAMLHRCGVVHADVHPGNVLAESSERLALIDFGLSRQEPMTEGLPAPARGAVAYYLEPEYACARLSREAPPPATMLSDQFAVAAILFEILAGQRYADFEPEKKKLYRQIANDPPRRFRDCGAAERPAVEAVLQRALSKAPEDRFQTIDDFEAAFVEALDRSPRPEDASAIPVARHRQAGASASRWQRLGELMTGPERLSRPGVGVTESPTASVNFGAAGLAYACYRIAVLDAEPELLSIADLWATRALADADRYEAMYDDDRGITPETVGTLSLYHTRTGLHCVRGLIAHARGDMVSLQSALDDYVAIMGGATDKRDLALGEAGMLLGAAILRDASPDHPLINVAPLAEAGRKLHDELWQWLAALGPVRQQREVDFLGIAHGVAGIVYALLQWNAATGSQPPDGVRDCLRQLADLGRRRDAGLIWPRKASSRHVSKDTMPGWCNGSAGFVFLWTLAARLLGDRAWMELAQGAAWDTYTNPDPAPNLCCGLAGRGFALLNMYRATNETLWLERARELGIRLGINESLGSVGLYKGDAGMGLFCAELEAPEAAAMPLFELERWRTADGLTVA